MSDSLDDKLREIVKNIVGASLGIEKPLTGSVSTSDYVPLIKQAFADEGYVKPIDPTAGLTGISIQKLVNEQQGYMTGQVFYDRFITETGKFPANTPNYPQIIEAAKRAAGLE